MESDDDEGLDNKYLSSEFNFDRAFVDFLITLGIFSDLACFVEVNEIILFVTEAAELIRKLVD